MDAHTSAIFPFSTGNSLFGQIWSKKQQNKTKQNRQFKLKFGTQTNSNKQTLMVLFTFSALDCKLPFCANLV